MDRSLSGPAPADEHPGRPAQAPATGSGKPAGRLRPGALVASAGTIGVLVVIVISLLLGGRLLGTFVLEAQGGFAGLVTLSATSVLFAAVGWLLVIRVPANRIGWLLLGTGICFAVALFGGVADASEWNEPGSVPGAAVFEWAAKGAWFLMVGCLWPQVMLLFPDGRLPSPRWRIVQVLQVAVLVMLTILVLAPSTETSGPDRVGVEALAPLAVVLEENGYPLALALMLAGALALVVRFRRSTGAERAQLKWVALVALVATLGTGAGSAVGLVSPDLGDQIGLLFFFGITTLPVAIGIAVLRYRLYEIDRVVSRTIGWGLVTAVLVGTFATAVLALQTLLAPVTANSTLAVAGSTLIAAALFAPLRTRIQRRVDQRFDRARYDQERLLAAFGERLRDEVDLPTITGDLLTTVHAALKPGSAGVAVSEQRWRRA